MPPLITREEGTNLVLRAAREFLPQFFERASRKFKEDIVPFGPSDLTRRLNGFKLRQDYSGVRLTAGYILGQRTLKYPEHVRRDVNIVESCKKLFVGSQNAI